MAVRFILSSYEDMVTAAQDALRDGIPREDVIRGFCDLLRKLRRKAHGDDEERVLCILDRLTGWCIPEQRL